MTKKTLMLAVCPLCKGEPTVFAMNYTRWGTQYAVGCKDSRCGASTRFAPKTIDEMVELWNGGVGIYRAGVPIKQMPGQMVMVTINTKE